MYIYLSINLIQYSTQSPLLSEPTPLQLADGEALGSIRDTLAHVHGTWQASLLCVSSQMLCTPEITEALLQKTHETQSDKLLLKSPKQTALDQVPVDVGHHAVTRLQTKWSFLMQIKLFISSCAKSSCNPKSTISSLVYAGNTPSCARQCC